MVGGRNLRYTTEELAEKMKAYLDSIETDNPVELDVPVSRAVECPHVRKSTKAISTTYNGKKLKEFRMKFKYSQKQIADMLGMNIAMISRYESGKADMTSAVIEKLNQAYKIGLTLDSELNNKAYVVQKYVNGRKA